MVRSVSATTRRLGALLPALLALAALGGCGSSSRSSHSTGGARAAKSASATSAGTSVAAIERAAYVTQAGEGMKLALKTTVQVAGRTITASGEGVFLPASKTGKLSINAAGQSVNEVIAYPYIYVHAPDTQLGSKPWLKLNAGNIASSLGISLGGASATNPTEELSLLSAAGSVRRVGAETLRGSQTTRYAVSVELNRLGEVGPAGARSSERSAGKLLETMTGQSTLAMEVWLDARGRARRVAMTLPICTAAERITATSSVEYFDFGPQPAITPPPASEVAEAGSAIEDAAKRGLSALHCSS
jgi:hypothetical protein